MNDKNIETDISKNTTEKTEKTNVFIKIWQDSVWSQVIAAGVLFLLPVLTAIILEFFKIESFSEFLGKFLETEIELYILLIIVAVLIVGYFIYLKFFKVTNRREKEYLNQKIGNYRFNDLNNILLTTYIKIPPPINIKVGIDELDLLTLFKMFVHQLNTGIDWNHPTDEGSFLYYNLGPRLMSYELCEKVPSMDNNTEGNINSFTIQTSSKGLKFFAFLEIYDHIVNREFYEKEFEEHKKYKEEILEQTASR